MAVDVGRHCYHGVFTVFGLQSSLWEVFRTDLFNLWFCVPVSSYGHVGMMPTFLGLMPNMIVRL